MGEMQKWVVLGWALLALVCAHDCPNGGHCEDDHTCCSAPENGYDCCPFQQAECCEDNIHCCPEGTLCNVQESGCINATMSFPWSERVSAGPPRLLKSFRMIRPYLGEDDDNICPDLSRCPPEFSCLRTLTQFGCCPLAQGVSCSDGKHCCPEGHQCSADSRSCIKKELVSTVMCSDRKSECPEETTCCEAPDGSWGCCPIPKAVCCEDKTHCCPEGSTCDVQQLKCMSLSTNKAMPMWAKLPARRRADWENQKEGAQVTAQVMRRNEVTTSPVTEQAENTVACEDCGQESTQGTEHVLTMLGDAETACNVSCDSNTACPDKTTCCKNTGGGWACCNLPEAVCCEDHMHCCPRGYTCDLTTQTCLGLSGSVPAVKKVPAYTTVAPSSQGTSQGTENAPTTHRDDGKASNISCDSTSSCPDGTTCCRNTSGGWDCCNMPEAVCCEDHINCCPRGYTCDMAEQMCNGLSGSVPAVKKVPAYTTVAPSSQGTSQGTEKAPTTHRDDGKASNISCDSTSSCPDGTTCCRNTSGGWDCCNMPEAVCCEDHINCCPRGYTCDMAEQMCNGLSGSVPAVKKVPAYTTVAPSTVAATTQELEEEEEEEEEGAEDGIPCDQHTSCPKHTTCCFMASTQKWGCCPLPEAVCCKGGVHCCPKRYSCDPKNGTCYKGEVVIPWYNKLPATNSLNAAPNAVECDVQNTWPEHSTCCQLSTGQWGCCPMHEAVCCPDMEHCCPQGYSCNLVSASCLKVTMLQLQRVPLTRVYGLASLSQPTAQPKLYDLGRVVQCEGQSTCKDGETCCRTSTTTWGCCPSLNAVCCNDMKHCCPAGHTCSKDGTCSQNTELSWDNWHQFFFNKKRALLV